MRQAQAARVRPACGDIGRALPSGAMRRALLGSVVTLAVLVAPASATAAPAAGVGVLGTTRDHIGLTITMRCTAAGTEACRVTALVRSPERPSQLLGRRSAFIAAGEVRAVQVALVTPRRASAAASEQVRLTVTARQGARRLGSPYRRTLRPQRGPFSLGITRFDGQPESATVKVQFAAGSGCPRRITLVSLTQAADGIELALENGGLSDPLAVCGQAARTGCVTLQLDAPLGQRAVWARANGVLTSPPPRGVPLTGYGPERWETCPQVAVGGTVDA